MRNKTAGLIAIAAAVLGFGFGFGGITAAHAERGGASVTAVAIGIVPDGTTQAGS